MKTERTIQPRTDVSGYLDEDFPCCRCNYNLRGTQMGQPCPECATPVLHSWNSHLGLYRRTVEDFKIPARIFSMLAGVILPIFCFMIAFWEPVLGPAWQSGIFSEKVGLLIGGPALYPFYLSLGYSVASMAMLVFKPRFFAPYWVVRFGVYSGVVLSLHFVLLVSIAIPEFNLIFLIAAALVALWLIFMLCSGKPKPRRPKRMRRTPYPMGRKVATILIGTTVAIAAITLVSVISAIIIVVAPGWTFLAYGLMSVRLSRSTFKPVAAPLRRLLPIAWISGYTAAWSLAIVQAMDAYTRLPTHAPECYICSAAARGHQRFVRSQTVLGAGASPVRVNQQLHILKMGELVLKAVAPTVHRCLRGCYDRIGPLLARRIRHPFTADLAYLTLKPIEWITLAVLACLRLNSWRRIR